MTRICVPYHLDDHLPGFDPPADADRTVTAELPDGPAWERMAALYGRVAARVADAAAEGPPLVMSADCTTALATVAGLQRVHGDLSVVWFDAHGDLHTPESTASGYLGGMPLRMLMGAGDATVPDALGLRPVPENRVLLVDGRDLDPPEAAYLRGARVRRAEVAALADGAPDALPPGPIYLHVDADVADAADLDGLEFPVSGGPGLGPVMAAVRAVLATGRVVGLGLACTWAPGAGAAATLRPHVAGLLA